MATVTKKQAAANQEFAATVNRVAKDVVEQSKKNMPEQGAVVIDGKAQGYGIAHSIIALVQGHANDMMRYVVRLAMTTPEGRDVCRKELALHVRQMGDIVKSTSPTGKVGEADPVFKGAKSSATTRLSEYGKIIQALDAGLDLEFKRDPQTGTLLVNTAGLWVTDMRFHEVVSRARLVLGSDAKGRGRPAKPFIDRLKALVEEYAKGPEDIKAGEELLHAMYQLTTAPKKEAKKAPAKVAA